MPQIKGKYGLRRIIFKTSINVQELSLKNQGQQGQIGFVGRENNHLFHVENTGAYMFNVGRAWSKRKY